MRLTFGELKPGDRFKIIEDPEIPEMLVTEFVSRNHTRHDHVLYAYDATTNSVFDFTKDVEVVKV